MKYLIRGGAGFTGSHLAEALLRRRDEVIIVGVPAKRAKTTIWCLFLKLNWVTNRSKIWFLQCRHLFIANYPLRNFLDIGDFEEENNILFVRKNEK